MKLLFNFIMYFVNQYHLQIFHIKLLKHKISNTVCFIFSSNNTTFESSISVPNLLV